MNDPDRLLTSKRSSKRKLWKNCSLTRNQAGLNGVALHFSAINNFYHKTTQQLFYAKKLEFCANDGLMRYLTPRSLLCDIHVGIGIRHMGWRRGGGGGGTIARPYQLKADRYYLHQQLMQKSSY